MSNGARYLAVNLQEDNFATDDNHVQYVDFYRNSGSQW